MQHPAHEERAHLGDELRGLAGLAHGLYEMRERVQGGADQADDELVVGGVEPVACESDVVGEILLPVGEADRRVLAQDATLLFRRELGKGTRAAQRIPDVASPRQGWWCYSIGRLRMACSRSGSWPIEYVRPSMLSSGRCTSDASASTPAAPC